MCKGEFSNGTPVIYIFVVFPAHLVKRQTPPLLQFLIDTGAEKTMINAVDAEKLGIEYKVSAAGISVPYFGGQQLTQGGTMGGVGGGITAYEVEDVSLLLLTGLDTHTEVHREYLSPLYVPEGRVRGIPNLLGRDLLSRFDVSWKSLESTIDLTRVAKPGRWEVTIA